MCVLVGVGVHECAWVKRQYYKLLLQPMYTIRDIWWGAPSNPYGSAPSQMSLRRLEHNLVDPNLTNGTVPHSVCIHLDFHDGKD